MKRRKPKNQLHNLKPIIIRITDISRGGAGVGRDENNRAIFVPYTAPGDLVKIKLTKASSKFAEAKMIELIEPSPERIAAKCPVFSRCGGCDWQHLPYDLQWKTKTKGVHDSLQRHKIEIPKQWDKFPAQKTWFYRNRIQLKGQSGEIGFYQAQSNKLVSIEQCYIANEKINATIASTKTEALQKNKAYKVELSLTCGGDIEKTWDSHHAATGFRQVNDEQNINLRSWIGSKITNHCVIFDLFGGGGNLSLHLAKNAREVHCVDLNTPSSFTPENPVFAKNFYYHRSAVLPWLKQTVRQAPLYSAEKKIALIDPPRDGLGDNLDEMLGYLKTLLIDRIFLVGCKTDTWSRDLSKMITQGWSLDEIAVFDFFPQTFHVETVAMLNVTAQ